MKNLLRVLLGNDEPDRREMETRTAVISETEEDAYWRRYYKLEPYIDKRRHFKDYQPAYRAGYIAFAEFARLGLRFDDVETQIQQEFEFHRGRSTLDWAHAKHAARAAWEKLLSS